MQEFDGRTYLLIDIANNFGLSKKIWEDRINWTEDHISDLENISEEAKEPILYRKAVRALRASDKGKAIGHPVSLDATASGLQILAILTGDGPTATNVNLIYTGKRENIYNKIAVEMSTATGKPYTAEEVKPPTMTVFYGSKREPKKVFGEDTAELMAFYSILNREAPGAMQALALIQSLWNPETLEHTWSMPDKHIIRAKVMAVVDKRIEIDELGHKTFTHRAKINMPQARGLSLAANIVHSIDGYIVREMVRRSNRSGFELATIHDSFWAHPNHMNQVRKIYVKILAELAQMDLLQSITDQLQPGWGQVRKSTDLSEYILQSEYALS